MMYKKKLFIVYTSINADTANLGNNQKNLDVQYYLQK